MTPVYPVHVVLDSDQHRVPLVAAKSREEARVRALGLGFGTRRVARVEQEEAGMTSERERATWSCEITGPALHADLPPGADFPMRRAVEAAYLKVTGQEQTDLSSGWGRAWGTVDRLMEEAAGVRLSPGGDLRAALEHEVRWLEQAGGIHEYPDGYHKTRREFDDAIWRIHGVLRAAAPSTATPPTPDGDLRAALRRWSDLEARRRITAYDADGYDDLEKAAGEAATVLIVEARKAGIADGLPNRALAAAPATPPTLDAALDVERLARAMRWAGVRSEPDFATIEEAARQVASDYDALPKFGYVARLSGDQQAAEDRERP